MSDQQQDKRQSILLQLVGMFWVAVVGFVMIPIDYLPEWGRRIYMAATDPFLIVFTWIILGVRWVIQAIFGGG